MICIEFGKDRYHQQNDMILWCKDNIGSGGWQVPMALTDHKWKIESMFGSSFFYFRDEQDAVLFSLKWS